MAKSHLVNAKEEIKRADHLIYISLKYTRTCDIMMNVINRLIEVFDELIHSALLDLKERGKIRNIPESKVSKAEELSKLKRSFKRYIDLYFLLKKIFSSDFIRREEYRKNVTLISQLGPNENLEVTVPVLTEYFKKTKEFIDVLEEFIE